MGCPQTGLANRRLSRSATLPRSIGIRGLEPRFAEPEPAVLPLDDIPSSVCVVAREGLEPPQSVPKTDVLPLDDRAVEAVRIVGTVRIELTTFGLKGRCAAWLRHAPALRVWDREESNLHRRGKSPLISPLTYGPVSDRRSWGVNGGR